MGWRRMRWQEHQSIFLFTKRTGEWPNSLQKKLKQQKKKKSIDWLYGWEGRNTVLMGKDWESVTGALGLSLIRTFQIGEMGRRRMHWQGHQSIFLFTKTMGGWLKRFVRKIKQKKKKKSID